MTNSHHVKRSQMVDAVLELLVNEGPSGVGAIAVARKLNLAPTTPYNYFTGREEMIDAALEKIHELMLRELASAIRRESAPLDALRSFTEASAGLIPYVAVIPRLLLDGCPNHRHWLELISRREAGFRSELAQLIAMAQEAGQVRNDIPPAKLARHYIGLGFQAFGSWSRSDGEIDLQAEAHEMWKLFESIATDRLRQEQSSWTTTE